MRRNLGGDSALQEMVEAQCASVSMRHEKQLQSLRQQLAKQDEGQRSLEVETRLMTKELEVMFKTEILDFTQDIESKFGDLDCNQNGLQVLHAKVGTKVAEMKVWHESRLSEIKKAQQDAMEDMKADMDDLAEQLQLHEETLRKSVENLTSTAKRESARVKRLEDRLKSVEFSLEERLSEPPVLDEERVNSLVDARVAPLAEQHTIHVTHAEANMEAKARVVVDRW